MTKEELEATIEAKKEEWAAYSEAIMVVLIPFFRILDRWVDAKIAKAIERGQISEELIRAQMAATEAATEATNRLSARIAEYIEHEYHATR